MKTRILIPVAALGVAFTLGIGYHSATSHANSSIYVEPTPMPTVKPETTTEPLPVAVTPTPEATPADTSATPGLAQAPDSTPEAQAAFAAAQATPNPAPSPTATPYKNPGQGVGSYGIDVTTGKVDHNAVVAP